MSMRMLGSGGSLCRSIASGYWSVALGLQVLQCRFMVIVDSHLRSKIRTRSSIRKSHPIDLV